MSSDDTSRDTSYKLRMQIKEGEYVAKCILSSNILDLGYLLGTLGISGVSEAPFYRSFLEGDMLQISPSPLCKKCGNKR